MNVRFQAYINAGLILSLGFFSYLMLLITLQYIPIDYNAAFLRIKQDEVMLPHYRLAFYTHVYSAMFALIPGLVQFSRTARIRFPALHRSLGKLYIFVVLFLAGPSGLVMAYYANGGIVSQIAFTILSLLWIFFTYTAYKKARNREFTEHQYYMYRSYALTLSAVSLRLFKWIIVNLFHPAPMDAYILVAWLGWIVNLLIAETLIVNARRKANRSIA